MLKYVYAKGKNRKRRLVGSRHSDWRYSFTLLELLSRNKEVAVTFGAADYVLQLVKDATASYLHV